MDGPHYAIGVDFGTESGARRPRRRRRRSRARHRRPPYANGVIDERLPAPDGDVRLAPDWALQDPEDYLGSSSRPSRPSSATPASTRRDVIGIGIDFTACTMLPTTADGTPLCVLAASARTRTPGSSSGSTTPRSPRPTGSTSVAARLGEPWLRPLRRQDLVRVVLRQGAADPRRGARGLRRGGPPHRGGRLGRLAADRRRDAQRLHGRLQGDVVEARRLPGRGVLRRARPPASPTSSTTKMSRDDRGRSASGPAGCPRRRRPGPGCCPGPRSRSPTSTPTSRCPASTVTEPGRMVMIMGTSTCHMVLAGRAPAVPGHVRLRRGRDPPGLLRLRGRAGVRRRPLRRGSSSSAVPPRVPRRGARARHRHPRPPPGEAARAAARRVRAAGARLVERQPVRPRRRRARRAAHRRDAGDDCPRRSTAR